MEDDEHPTLQAGRWTDAHTPWPTAPRADEPPAAPPPPPPSNRGRFVAITILAAALAAIVGFGATLAVLDARSNDKNANNRAGGSTPSTSAPSRPQPTDPSAVALGSLILRQSDVADGNTVHLVPNGTDAVGEPTLDLCNGTYPSESLRTARRQVVVVTPAQSAGMSTEAVLYKDANASAQAFSELRSVVTNCPHRPVVSPVGEDTATTEFHTAPDGDWPRTPGVEREAYDFTTTNARGTDRSIAVYLRRGRVLMGLYFPGTGTQDAVDGKTAIPAIVNLFEQRVAALPTSVVNGAPA